MKQLNGIEKQYSTDKNLNIRLYLHHTYSINQQGWSKWVFQNYELPPKAEILELGCGNGIIWKDNKDLIPDDVTMVLTDFSEGMLQTTKENLSSLSPIEYKVMNIEDINYPNQSFDTVIANHMLYHVNNREQAFREIRRVLKPNGTFYATTIGRDNMKEFSAMLKEYDPGIDYDYSELAESFCLENGKEQLGQYFSDITVRYYEDGLKITEAEPLVQYVLSMEGIRNVSEIINKDPDKFRAFLADRIKRDGAINITKSAGIFIAK